jgi:hypothetical protein
MYIHRHNTDTARCALAWHAAGTTLHHLYCVLLLVHATANYKMHVHTTAHLYCLHMIVHATASYNVDVYTIHLYETYVMY